MENITVLSREKGITSKNLSILKISSLIETCYMIPNSQNTRNYGAFQIINHLIFKIVLKLAPDPPISF